MPVTIHFNENTPVKIDLDGDGKYDRATVVADPSANGSTKISGTVYIDLAKDGFSKETLITRKFSQDAKECNSLSAHGQRLRFSCQLDAETLVKRVYGQTVKAQTASSMDGFGRSALQSDLTSGIGGLVGSKGTAMGSGGFGVQRGGLDSVDRSLEDAAIKRHMNQIRYAYQKQLAVHPKLAGEVTVKIYIAKDGSVSKAVVVNSQWNDEKAGAQVNQDICSRIQRIKFPEVRGGGIKIIDYPFTFAPN